MTGRPGDHKMEMNARSTASYLTRTPRVPLFMLILIGLEAKGLLAFQARRGMISVVRWNLRLVIFGVELRFWSQHRIPNLHLWGVFHCCYVFSLLGDKFLLRRLWLEVSRTKIQPKEEVFGTDISRTSGGHSRGYPSPKLGADVHDPKGFPKT